jgi:nucleoid DNA-binding protein
MNKAELISRMAELADVTKVQADFENKYSRQSERAGRNPRTGEALKIPEKRVVKFRAGKGLINSLLKMTS